MSAIEPLNGSSSFYRASEQGTDVCAMPEIDDRGPWERREERRRSERLRMQKHGASIRRIYAGAVRKRLHARRKKKSKNA
jgi:hypothetical protein